MEHVSCVPVSSTRLSPPKWEHILHCTNHVSLSFTPTLKRGIEQADTNFLSRRGFEMPGIITRPYIYIYIQYGIVVVIEGMKRIDWPVWITKFEVKTRVSCWLTTLSKPGMESEERPKVWSLNLEFNWVRNGLGWERLYRWRMAENGNGSQGIAHPIRRNPISSWTQIKWRK